jgi:hypothetical protein
MPWLSYVVAFAKNLNPFKAVKLEIENPQLQRDKIALEQQIAKLLERDEIKCTAPGYVHVGSGSIAYCATCYETKNQQLVSLEPRERWSGGVRRMCPSCRREYCDQPPQKDAPGTNTWFGSRGKDDWML